MRRRRGKRFGLEKRSASGWVRLRTMIGSAAVHVLWRSTAAALLGLSLLLGLAAPNEAHAQQGCQVGTAKHRAGLKFDHHRQASNGELTVATATYRALIALGETTLPAWTGANISGNAPTTAISVTDLRTVLESEGLNPQEPGGWRIITSELACVERGLPAITISGGPEVSEGADAQFTVNVSRASGSAMTVNLTVADVPGSDFVASGNEGSQTVSIPANQTSVTYPVPIVNDASDEANGYVTVTVVGGGVGDGYTYEPDTKARVWVSDSNAGQVLISNVDQTAGGAPADIRQGRDRAQAFTTGSRTSGYTLKSVDVVFNENSLDDLFRTSNPRLTATIRNASGENPGTVVGTLNLPRSSPTFDSPRTVTFRAPAKGIMLSPSTTYFFMIDVDATHGPGRNDAKLRIVSPDAEHAGGAAGFSIADDSRDWAWWRTPPEWTHASGRSMRISVKGELNPFTDVVQMNQPKLSVAEFGNFKDDEERGVRIVVEIGDGMSLQGYPRTINYTLAGSADRGEGKDYTVDGCTSSTCSVKLPANRHSAVITIYVNDDGLDENDETIDLTLQDGSGYTLNQGKKKITITIRDDDTRGLTFHRRWPDIDEGSSDTITVRLSSQPTAAVTVNIASDNPDVTASPTSLTFNPTGSNRWNTVQTVTIAAAQDSDAVDDTATLTYTTSGGDYGGANALSIKRTVPVDDDDTSTTVVPRLPRISLTGGAAVTEGSAASFTLEADPAPAARLTVNVEVVEPPGQDFVAASHEGVRTVTLNAGATSTTFTVPTVNDNTAEADGRVQVFVNDGTGYSAGGGSAVDVNDDDDPTPAASFSSASSSVGEGDGSTGVRVNLTRPAPSGGLTIRYTVTGTATAGSGNDFTIQSSGTLTVAAGATSAIIPVAINDDSATENAETVILTLIGGTGYTPGSTTVHTLTINDNDNATQPAASFASAASSAAESAGTRNVTVNLSSGAPSGGVTIGYSVTGTATAGSGNDFTIQNSGTLSIAAGATSATIPVAINDDSATENAETVILTLSGGTGYTLGSTTVHTLTITDNDNASQPAASFTSAASSAAESAGTRNVTVNLSSAAPSGGLSVGYRVTGTATAGNGNDFTIQNSGTLSIAAGATSATIPVAINDDNATENSETVILTLSRGTGYTLGSRTVHTLTITDNDSPRTPALPAASFASAYSSATESVSTRNVTVNLSSAAPSGGLSVGYRVTGTATAGGSNDFTIQNSGTLSIAAGATSATIPVAVNDDNAQENVETVILTLRGGTGYTLGSPTVHTLTITDNDSPRAPARESIGADSGDSFTVGGGITDDGPARDLTPSEADFEWSVDRDLDELDSGHALPTGMWSDGATLWLLHNASGAGDAVYAYDIESGERLEDREFALAERNRAPRGIWSDGTTVWVSDSGQDKLFASVLATSERLEDRDIELAERNADARGIWSDGETMWVLDGGKDSLFAYDLASGGLLAEYALAERNHDPHGLWSDGVSFWVSDHGLKQLWAYHVPALPEPAVPEGGEPPDEPPALERVGDEDFTHLSRASNNSPRGIWSDGALMYVADAHDGRIYSYNMPDAIDARLTSLELSGIDFGEFDPRRTEYDGVAAEGVTTTTVVAVAAQTDATVVIEPVDDDTAVEGHQAALTEVEQIAITVTSEDGSRERSYRVRLAEIAEAGPSASCLHGAVNVGFSLVLYEGGSLDELVACAEGRHATALYVLVDGNWVSYFSGEPDFVNTPFQVLFADGVPTLQPLIVHSAGPASPAPPAPEVAEPFPTCLNGEISERFSLVVYEGGSVEDLVACAESLGVGALYVLHDGTWVSYILGVNGVSEFVNAPFRALFTDGVPVATPLSVWGKGSAQQAEEAPEAVQEEETSEEAESAPATEAAGDINDYSEQTEAVADAAPESALEGKWVIAKTGGQGVSHRMACRDDARVSELGGWPDGTEVELIEEGTGSCADWVRVRADGITSWVRNLYVFSSTADSQSMVGSRWIIGNTGGEGVSHRAECVDDARVGATGGWPDGTVVTARAAGEGQCAGWLRVEAADGVTSWVREEYLAESLGPAFPRTT